MKPPAKKQPPRRTPPPNTYHRQPVEETTAGRLFRVRDKDWAALWGENLTHEDAVKLKEQVVTRGKSRTARVEDMDVPPPDWYTHDGDVLPLASEPVVDPQLEALRAKATQVSRETAATAQQRHAVAAARDRSSGASAVRTAVGRPPVPPRPVPVISTEIPEEIGDDDQLGDGDLHDLMADAGSDQPSELELARAKAQADKDAEVLMGKARELYEANRKDGHIEWTQLSRAAQAGWRVTAMQVMDDERRKAAQAPAAASASE